MVRNTSLQDMEIHATIRLVSKLLNKDISWIFKKKRENWKLWIFQVEASSRENPQQIARISKGSEYIGELTNGAGKYFMDAGNILFHMTGQVIDDWLQVLT